MKNLHSVVVVRRSRLQIALPRASALVAVALALVFSAFTPRASAQSSKEMVGGPITTKRFERLIRGYIAPTDEQMSALDRLHAGYLEKFRAELGPQLDAIAATMGGGQPNKDQFEKFMRDLDRASGQIAEADNAFLTAATDLLPPDRQPLMLRVREARERQRLLSGMVQFAPMMFGGGSGFVDFPNLLLKDSILAAVTPESREAFDSALRSQESRVLSQARSYNAAVRKALTKFFDVYSAMVEGGADPTGNGADPEALQMQMMQALADLGADFRKDVKSNLEANRSACAQFATMLPEATMLALRLELATRSVGMMAQGFGGNGGAAVKLVVARIRRDPATTPEMVAQLDALLATHTKDYVVALEAFAVVVSESNASMMMMMGGGNEADQVELAKATERIQSVRRTAMSKLAELLGDRAETFVRKYAHKSEDGTLDLVDYYPVKEEKKSEEADEAAQVSARSSFASGFSPPIPFDAADVVRIGTLVGLDSSSQSVVEAVVEEWKSSQWDAQMDPLAATLTAATQRQMSAGGDGEVFHDLGAAQTVAQTRAAMAKALFELDEKLYVDLAGALGLAADDPALILLRLERTDLIPSRGGWQQGTTAFPYSVSRLLASGKVDSATARAIIVGGTVEFLAIANELPTQLADRVTTAAKRAETERVFATRDQASIEAASRKYQESIAASTALDAEFAAKISAAFDAAVDANVTDATLVTALKRARVRSMYPQIYRAKDSAERQLTSAANLSGLNDDQLGRLEVLRAEYEVVYDSLSSEMATLSTATFPLGATPEEWQEYSKRQAAVEQVRFRRSERTEKTLGELRRILGSELAVKVPDLVPDADASAGNEGEGFNRGEFMMQDED